MAYPSGQFVIQQQQQPQVTVVNDSSPPPQLKEASRKGILGLSITQMVMGGLCIILEIALMNISWYNLITAPGIWGGAAILITGGIGLGTAIHKSHCWVIAYMVLNIIAASIFIPSFIGVSATATAISNSNLLFNDQETAATALNALNVTMAAAQFIITIVASAICCGAVCCPSARPATYMVGHTNPMVITTTQSTTPYGYPVVQQQQQQYQVMTSPGYQPQQAMPMQPPDYQKM